MPKKRKHTPSGEESKPRAPKAPGIGTALGPLLQRAGLDRKGPPRRRGEQSAKPASPPSEVPPAPVRPAPAAPVPGPEALSPHERALLHQTYRDVEPIRRPKRGRIEPTAAKSPRARSPAEAAEEAAARARLSELVGGGVRFEVAWEDGLVQGLRVRAEPRLLARLSRSAFEPEARLDLHGLRRAEVERAVSQFVRGEHRRGRRYLLLITGQGHHSEDGTGVLGHAAVEALSRGSAAPLVLAFASAHARHGGRGALAVMLG